MTVGELKAACAGLPDGMRVDIEQPVNVGDDFPTFAFVATVAAPCGPLGKSLCDTGEKRLVVSQDRNRKHWLDKGRVE